MFDIIPNRTKYRDTFRLDNFFREFIPDTLIPNPESKMMRIDIKEHDNDYTFDVELPGVKKEDIDINIIEDMMTISVKKNEEVNEQAAKYIRKERKYGSYSRSFTIPDINSDAITAHFNAGILTVTLPKTVKVQETKKCIDIK